MSSGIVSGGTWRTQQRHVGTYSGSDPSNTSRGEWWIRTDKTPKTDQIAQFRQDNGTSTPNKAPIFSTSVTLGSDVYVGPRFKFDDGTVGFIPVTDQGGAVGSPRLKNDDGTVYESHDALELSAIPDEVIDHFESAQYEDQSATLSDYYSTIVNSGLANSQRQQTTVQEGNYALQIDSANGNGQAIGSLETDGLNRYPNQGETWRQWGRTGTNGSEAIFAVFGLQALDFNDLYLAGIRRSNGDLAIIKRQSGGPTLLNSAAQSWSDSTWYDIEISWDTDGTIVCGVYDDNGSLINSTSATDTEFSDGGFGWYQTVSNGGATTFHDYARVV